MFAVRLLERAIKIYTKSALGLCAEYTEIVWLDYLKSTLLSVCCPLFKCKFLASPAVFQKLLFELLYLFLLSSKVP